MTDHASSRPDAFKALMTAARSEGRPELAHQSLGRSLTGAESALAAALMAVYAEGISDPAGLADALAARDIARPSTGKPDWTAETLAAELTRLNADLDAAYRENGFGA